MNKYRLDTYTLLCAWLPLACALELSRLGLETTVALHSCTLPCGRAITWLSNDDHLGSLQSSHV